MLFSLDVEQESGGFEADHRLSMSPSPGKSTLKKQGSDGLDHKVGGPLSWTSALNLRQATLTLRFSYSLSLTSHFLEVKGKGSDPS